MLKELKVTLIVFALLTLVTGVAYPGVVWIVAQLAMPERATGSVIERDGKAVGSALLGQSFSSPRYFWGRPSATGPVANNGAAGLPNFADTHFGVITRISLRPVEGRRLYGMRIASAFVDAIPVEFDPTLWLRKFESTWPPESPAYTSYHSRIVNGPLSPFPT